MSRAQKTRAKKPQGAKGAKRSKQSSRRYWTLAIWPMALAVLLFYQAYQSAKRRESVVDAELKKIETRYAQDTAELQLQIDLLEKQIEIEKAQ